jgi:hypothetical protein
MVDHVLYLMKSHFSRLRPLGVLILILLLGKVFGQTAAVSGKPSMETPVQVGNLDSAVFSENVNGLEKTLAGLEPSQNPQWVVWTDSSSPGYSGCEFGDTKIAGERHLRIGFKSPLMIGSVFAAGGGRLSVLKANAVYPGRLDNNADWLEAERVENGKVSHAEVPPKELAGWVLPPGTETRALRFSHLANASDETYAGHLEGVFITSERYANVAPEAQAGAENLFG